MSEATEQPVQQAEEPVEEESRPAVQSAPGSAPRTRTSTRKTRNRTPKQDAVLTEAVALAREAVVAGADGGRGIGEHLGVVVHEDRLLTHLFDCTLRGYPGWTWYATVARAPRSKHVTVCESGLISGAGSLLAPPWVPWDERVQAGETGTQDEEPAPDGDPEGDAAGGRGGDAEDGASS